MNRTKALLIYLILMMAPDSSSRFWMTPPAAHAQTAAQRAFITKRSGTFNGQLARYVATVGGETIAPESGAFGPCFERRPAKFEVDGKEVEGFEWVRAPSVPEARCREW